MKLSSYVKEDHGVYHFSFAKSSPYQTIKDNNWFGIVFNLKLSFCAFKVKLTICFPISYIILHNCSLVLV